MKSKEPLENMLLCFEIREHTREDPGDGLISVLRIRVSLSCPYEGLFLNGWRIGNDQIPRDPLIVRILRFFKVGRSRYDKMNNCRVEYEKSKEGT